MDGIQLLHRQSINSSRVHVFHYKIFSMLKKEAERVFYVEDVTRGGIGMCF